MSHRNRYRRTRRNRFARLRSLAAFAFIGMLLASPFISRAWSSISDRLPSLEKEEEYHAPDATLIFDSSPNPNVIAVLNSGEERMVLAPEQIPEKMKQAIVAIEDDRFFEHSGIDPLGMARAFFSNFTEGRLVEGGSTITQQYIKNAYVSSEPSIQRKLKEALYAYELEQRWSKDRILGDYLNTIYFGNSAYGLQVAAFTYFNKPAAGLALAECALLAGLPKSPVQYSPFTSPEAARGRRNLVLAKMLRHGWISREEYDQAVEAPLPDKPSRFGPESTRAPYFVEYVKQQLIARYGVRRTFEGGLRVYTTIDMGRQAAAEKSVATVLNQPADPSASLVSLEPGTGYVRAMVGGRNFSEQKFNVATQGHRQPGSAFKPFVLATAMNKGISPGTTFVSEPKQFHLGSETAVWNVANFDSLYLGKISLEKATVYSDNAVYADLMMRVGAGEVADLAHKAGITTSFSAHPAIALGGLDNGVSPLELTSAYGTFANGGKKVSGSVDFDGGGGDPVTILKVTDSQGNVIDENQPVATPVLDPVIAYHVNSVLAKTATSGLGRWSNLGRPSAGKSGTTEDHVDAWYSGYTPDLVTTVWIGYIEQRRPMTDVRGVRVTGGSWPAQIWHLYMQEALAGVAPNNFAKPPNSDLVKLQICVDSGLLAELWCPKKESRTFFPNNLPREKCNLHRPHEVTMPSLKGMKLADAWRVIRELGFEAEIGYAGDGSKPADEIVDQKPAPGTKLMQGRDRIAVIMAGLPGSVSVPETEEPEY